MRLILITLLALVCAFGAAGQTQPATPNEIGSILMDPANLSTITAMAGLAANVSTDWSFTGPITKKQYTFTPAQTSAMIGGGTVLFLTLDHYLKPGGTGRKITTAVKVAISAYLAGRALANTYGHGLSAAAAGPAPPAQPAFAVRLRR